MHIFFYKFLCNSIQPCRKRGNIKPFLYGFKIIIIVQGKKRKWKLFSVKKNIFRLINGAKPTIQLNPLQQKRLCRQGFNVQGHIYKKFQLFSQNLDAKNTGILIIIFFLNDKKYLKDGDNSNFRSKPFKKYDHGGNDRIDTAASEVTGVSTPQEGRSV